jgi:hypothetical protein
MFEPALLAKGGVARGLLFVDTDHGFNLGHDPAQNERAGLLVARFRGDAHDRELYERLGQPPTYRYVYDFKGRPPQVFRYAPAESTRFEAEAEWPALPSRGSAYPIHHPCASRARALRLLPGTRVSMPLAASGATTGTETGTAARVTIGWAAKTGQGAQLSVRWSEQSQPERLTFPGGCSSLEIAGPEPKGQFPLLVELVSGEGALDFLDVGGPAPPGSPPRPGPP